MAGAHMKINFFFTLGKSGWSETYYINRGSLDAAMGDAHLLAFDRASVLVAGCRLEAIRVSDDEVQRDALLKRVDIGPQKAQSSILADVVWTCLHCRLQAGNGYWRALMLRGIPDDVAGAGAALGNAPFWNQAVNKYMDALKSTFSIKVITRADLRNDITFVETNVLGTSVTFAANHGLSQGDTVLLYRRPAMLPHSAVVRTRVSDTVVILKPKYDAADMQLHPPAWKKRVYDYPAITVATSERISHRDTGRPFDQQRGRRSTRRTA